MRKKLEAKKVSSKDLVEKLSGESKSVIDFKVPEIPIKKIQEIYKNSDLLRSKSDSDFLTINNQNTAKINETDSIKTNINNNKNNLVESLVVPNVLYAVSDEFENDLSDNSATHSYKTKSNSEEIATQKSIMTTEMKRSSSQSSNISEEISSDAYSITSQSEHVLTAKISDALSSQDVSEKIECSSSLPEKNQKDILNVENENLPSVSDDASLIFSKKLDHIHLHNRELNDDINNLENDLKTLTEMMSNFSKKSSNKSKSTDKSTLKDVSAELTTSQLNVQSNIDQDLKARIDDILSDVIPETDDLATSIEEFDVKVKKLDILNTTNKSSLSDEISNHTTGAQSFEDNNKIIDAQTDTIISEVIVTSVKEDEEYDDKSVNSLNFDKFSSANTQDSCTTEMESKNKSTKTDHEKTSEHNVHSAMQDDKNIDDKISDIEEVSSSEIVSLKIDEIVESVAENVNDKETKSCAAEEISTSIVSKVDEMSMNDYISENNKGAEISVAEDVNTETNAKIINLVDNCVLSDCLNAQKLQDENLKTDIADHENDQTKENNKSEYQNGISDIDDSAFFIPRGESTNIQDTFVLQLDETTDIGIRSKEFNDILDIIEKTKIDQDLSIAPTVLELESQNFLQSNEKVDCNVLVKNKIITDDTSESIEEEIEDNKSDSGDELKNKNTSAVEDKNLSQIEIGTITQLDEDKNDKEESNNELCSNKNTNEVASDDNEVERINQACSDGEQLDNLVEVVESKIDTIDKQLFTNDYKNSSFLPFKKHVTVFLNKTFDIIKDSDYDDISEESLEVSEIFDKSERVKRKSKKFSKIPEKYVIKSKSDEVLRILDDLSIKSNYNLREKNRDVDSSDEDLKITSLQASPLKEFSEKSFKPVVNSSDESLKISDNEVETLDEEEKISPCDKTPKITDESSQSDGMDTPSGISEIEMDSPKEANDDSRLDVDALDDDLLSGNSILIQTEDNEAMTEFHTRPMGVSSEEDINAMILKLQGK